MKKILLITTLLALIVIAGLYAERKLHGINFKLRSAKKEIKELSKNNEIQDGDLIFQTDLSPQSKAVELATKSIYSHCGIIFRKGNDFLVYEAVQPVRETALEKWIARGKDGKYVIKRLKSADKVLTPAIIAKMKQEAEKSMGKDYDLTFEWSDDKMYCSEFIWKIYQRATGIEIGKLQHLKDMDLTSEAVKEKLKERYGSKIPMNETVVSPQAIFESELLTTVKSN
ncbi:YiiX family permuted papain-like enzyme [Pinibacter soli]|uniref:YiiX family permuted papain-like enzyme n=1 Tax=Pinibacter soli TaxID=3044211 RepID=A0ABT6R9X8_9BACT|nr:YiiX family permuted papain-like enzyme [Pinibacter soli]MDI3319376.1 YiiX family permuted papain-like enzyme [Pinibacter soli]